MHCLNIEFDIEDFLGKGMICVHEFNDQLALS